MSVYFPVLRWKQGERCALANLDTAIKPHISPIIEFPLDCEHIDRKITDFCVNAVSDWGTEHQFYLDLSHIDFTAAQSGSNHPALSLLRIANQEGLQVIPVLNPDIDPDLLAAIQRAHDEVNFDNIALRINENADDSALDDAIEMVTDMEVPISQVDLIIDLFDISSGAVQANVRVLNTLVNYFGTDYRNTVVICGAMPGQLADYVGTDDDAYLPRHDWQLWIRARGQRSLSHIKYGDYTTIPCEFRDVPFRGAPKIKYTLDRDWYIIKGHRSRGRDNQRQEQAQQVTNAEFFRGSDYSFGDRRISDCATGDWGPGNSTNWVTNDVSQHIAYVVSQVSAILAAT